MSRRYRATSHALTDICLLSYAFVVVATTFDVLAEPSRRRILDLLRERDRPVGELVGALELSQPGVSKHLRVLRQAGLVDVRPDGRRRVYAIRPEPLAEIDAWLEPYRGLWAERLDALERHLHAHPDREEQS
jgi:DNA-binding transcriptional ArsR family regulator